METSLVEVEEQKDLWGTVQVCPECDGVRVVLTERFADKRRNVSTTYLHASTCPAYPWVRR